MTEDTGSTVQENEEHDIVTYSAENGIAWIAMNRPKYNNAQNGRMTYELDDAFKRAVADDAVKVIVLRGEANTFLRVTILELRAETFISVKIGFRCGTTMPTKRVVNFFTFVRLKLTSVCVGGGGTYRSRLSRPCRAPVLPGG